MANRVLHVKSFDFSIDQGAMYVFLCQTSHTSNVRLAIGENIFVVVVYDDLTTQQGEETTM